MRVMSFITVATNAALILWTSTLFEGLTDWTKCFIFVLSVQVCLIIWFAIEQIISDVPCQLKFLMRRHEHIVAVVFKGLYEGDDSNLTEVAEELDLTVYPNEEWDDRANAIRGSFKARPH
jgi:hypothetical protein